jgi:diguanylate cyclase (GGDEF)-like protein/PAS domain S-box-containing protein
MMQAVLDSSTDQIVRYDRDGRAEYVNDEVVRFTGVSREQWIGHDPAELGFPEQRAQTVLRHIRRVFDEGVGHRFEISYDHPAGLHHFEVSLSPVVDGRGNVEAVMADSRDMSERHQTEAELADRATHDRLTGLANREVLIAEVDRALAACRRSGRSVGLLMIDLDHFKNVNDALGHEAGDHLLIAVAARLASIARAGDLIARLGGDEFVIVLRDIEGITAAVRQAQRAVDAFHSPVQFDEHDIYTTTSIGVALSTSDSTSSDLLREADTALYLAKGRGRDKVGVFSASLRVAATERLQVEADLQPALERGQFAVWYQPQIDLRTGEVVAVEALLRWHHPSGEVLNADQFIDLAEDSGMISDIGDWALLEACTQTARWNAEPGAPQLAIGVNISTRQLAEADLFAKVAAALTLSGLDPTLLCIEITETTLLVQTTESRENLRRLHAAGIRLAIDDFGTGYASLAYLREIHVDTVKIDRSFVSDIATNDFDRRLIDGIIALADRLGVDVIAEGVETEEQADTLRALGCTSAQGYLYSRAVPADELQRQHHPPATRAR